MFTLIKPHTKINFMGKKWLTIFVIISSVMTVASFVSFFTKGIKFGVDFTGGIEIQVKFNGQAKPHADIIRSLMGDVRNGADLQVQNIGDESNYEYLIKMEGTQTELESLSNDIKNKFDVSYSGEYEIRKVDMVGPKVGKELRNSGIYALIYAILGIALYIAVRFDYKFAPGAIISLVHDVIIVVGIYSILGKQFTLSTVAAILTIIGYSINDTVVVYDRIRETMGKSKEHVSRDLINRSVNETLSRTMITVLATLFVVGMLLFFGGEGIGDLSFALFVGLLFGCYSSVFVASPMVLVMEYYSQHKEKKIALKTKNA
jgi:preprotein translocase subunit SecF